MKVLYLVSPEDGAGKTALGGALARGLAQRGKKVGFLKPLAVTARPPGSEHVDGDAQFFKKLLGLKEPLSTLVPLVLSAGELPAALAQNKDGFRRRLLASYSEVSKGKDVLIAEGPGGLTPSTGIGMASREVASLLQARAVITLRYQESMSEEDTVAAAKALGQHLAGVVVNAVPVYRQRQVRETLVPSLERQGVKVLGVLPEERLMLAITVGELADLLGGEVLCCPEATDGLIESFMVGCNVVDPGPTYFSIRDNKAVIVRGDRPDIQMPALSTSVRCLVLTGNTRPIQYVMEVAEEKGVPIILVKQGTVETLDALGGALKHSTAYHEKKVEKLQALLSAYTDLAALYSATGLDG